MSDGFPKKLAGKTMKYGLIGTLYSVVHDLKPPSDAAWSDYVADMERHARILSGVFVYTRGGGPNPGQRRQVSEMWRRVGENPPIAVILPSTFVRGVITALNFFLSRPIKGFSPEQLADGLSYLNVPQSMQAGWRTLIDASLAELSAPQ